MDVDSKRWDITAEDMSLSKITAEPIIVRHKGILRDNLRALSGGISKFIYSCLSSYPYLRDACWGHNGFFHQTVSHSAQLANFIHFIGGSAQLLQDD